MAIDSEIKRKSAAQVGNVCQPVTILPDSTIAKFDRQVIGWGYGGIVPVGEATKKFLALMGVGI